MKCDNCGKELRKNEAVTQATIPVRYFCYKCAGVSEPEKNKYQDKMMRTKRFK